MVKSPKIRHSKPGGEPLTIELSGDDVKRVEPKAEPTGQTEAARPTPSSPPAGTSASHTSAKPAEPAAAVKPEAASAASAKPVETPPKPTAASSTSASGPKLGTSQPYGASSSASSAAASSSTASSADAAAKPASAPSAATSAFGRDPGKGATATPPPPTPKPTTARPEPAPRRTGSALLAGLLGGVIALGGAGAAWYGGLIELPAQPAAPAAPAQPDNAAVDALRAELASLRAAVDDLRATPPAAPGEAPDLSGVNARIEGLATLVEDLRAQLAGIGEGGGGSPADSAALAALRDQLAALEARVAALPAEGGADLSGLREELGAASALARQASEAATQAATSVGALTPRFDKIESDLAALTAQVAEAANDPGVAIAIAASALKAAVDRGQPFATELDTFAKLAPDSPEVAALRPYAETGVPTRADIDGRFEAAASAMIAAGRSDDANAGFFERLWGSAISVVEVRPIGEVQGDDAPAAVARMEVALTRGDYARVIAEFEKLPEASRNAGAAFMESVRARHAADDLVGKALAAALRA